MRVGLIGAPICFAVAAVGFAMKLTGAYDDGRGIPGVLIVGGIAIGTAMLIVALAAWRLGPAKPRKP